MAGDTGRQRPKCIEMGISGNQMALLFKVTAPYIHWHIFHSLIPICSNGRSDKEFYIHKG